VLSISRLSKSFGGVQALRNIDISVEAGMIYGIIGPNGAGKTTLFNIVTGVVPSSSGTIRFGDFNITELQAHQRSRVGISRTFQNIRLFGSLSVLDNVLVGQSSLTECGARSMLPIVNSRREKDLRQDAEEFLALFGLYEVRHRYAKELPYADQRRVELARALSAHPRLLLLDEPTAGMNEEESAELAAEIRKMSRPDRIILLIEHDMSVIMSLSQRIAVLNFGELIGEGPPEQIKADPRVIEAYLGRED